MKLSAMPEKVRLLLFLWRLQDEYLAKHKKLCMHFLVYLEKALAEFQ